MWLPFAVILLASAAIACMQPRGREPQAPPWKPFTLAILEDYDKGDDLAEVGRDFEMFRELGISIWRGSLGWDDYEPERGRYDFEWLHRFLTLAAEHKISARPYVGYTPEWAAGGRDNRDGQAWNQPPKDLSAWSAFVAALATELRHHPNVRSMEVYNEQNVAQWWEGTVQEYARTLAAAAKEIRRAAPFDLLAGGLVFPDVDWVETVCSDPAARNFDELPVHAYPETWTPPDITVENYLANFEESFVAAADRACGRKRISINETGFATVPGKSEADQAAWWARAIAVFAAQPRVEHVGVYEVKDLPQDREAIGDAPNYHLGLARADRTRKLAFSTVRMLAGLLNTGRIAVTNADAILAGVKPHASGERHHRVFTRPDGDRVLIVWNRSSDDMVSITLKRPHGTVEEFGLGGEQSPLDGDALTALPLRRGIPRIFRIRAH